MKTKTLIIGASSVGLATAISVGDCIVVEKGMNLCTDYTDCMNNAMVDMEYVKKSEKLTFELFSAMERKNLVSSQGRIHIFPIVGVFARLLLENNVKVMSFSTVKEIIQTENGFCVKFFSLNDHLEIECENIVDATVLGDFAFEKAFNCEKIKAKKRICASLRRKNIENGFDISDKARIVMGKFSDEAYLEVDLEENDTYSDGFFKIHSLWQENCENDKLSGLEYIDTAEKLAVITEDFCCFDIQKGVKRIIPDTSKDIFYNVNQAVLRIGGENK